MSLGCTHYPFVLDVFKATFDDLRRCPEYAGLLASGLTFVDPAEYTARACRKALAEDGLLHPPAAPRPPKRMAAFISVGRDGPLSPEVKYGRFCGCHDLETVIVPLTTNVLSTAVVDGIGKSFPVCRRELGL